MSENTQEPKGFKKSRFRSPPYPAITLGKAIERAGELHKQALQNAVPTHVLAHSWGFTTKSSAINSTAAALKQFGLLLDEGSGDKRRFKLSDDAVRIVTDPVPNSPKRLDAVKRSALSPKIHSELWEQYGLAGLSGSMDVTLQSYLTLDRKDAGEAPYSESAAKEVISVYKDSISYAGLGQSDIIPELGQQKSDSGNQNESDKDKNRIFGGAKVGDLVQRESDGVLTFEKALKVRAIQEHDGQQWVFVEGTETGFLMSEIIVEQAGKETISPFSPRLSLDQQDQVGVWKESTDLDEGDAYLVLPEKMSPESYDDLKAWLDNILRKAKRRAGVQD